MDCDSINNLFGVNQKYYNCNNIREFNKTYINNTGRTIFVSLTAKDINTGTIIGIVDGTTVVMLNNLDPYVILNLCFFVPPNSEYRINHDSSDNKAFSFWVELK